MLKHILREKLEILAYPSIESTDYFQEKVFDYWEFEGKTTTYLGLLATNRLLSRNFRKKIVGLPVLQEKTADCGNCSKQIVKS